MRKIPIKVAFVWSAGSRYVGFCIVLGLGYILLHIQTSADELLFLQTQVTKCVRAVYISYLHALEYHTILTNARFIVGQTIFKFDYEKFGVDT